MNFESNRQVPPEWALGEVTLRCAQPGEIATARAVLARERYLGAPAPCNCDVVQPATRGEQVLAIVVWTRVAQRLAARDSWVGWDARTRVRRVPLLVQNNRFLALASVRQPNLASRVPGLAVAALPAAWEKRHGVAPLMAETFVDPERHQGTCCKAAEWTEVGASAGWGRHGDDYYVRHDQPKSLWLRALSAGARQRLRGPLERIGCEKKLRKELAAPRSSRPRPPFLIRPFPSVPAARPGANRAAASSASGRPGAVQARSPFPAAAAFS